MMCYHDATASPFVSKVQGGVFTYFYAVTVKVTLMCKIEGLACQDEFLVNNPLDVKENDEHALDFALDLPHLFWPALIRACHSNTCVQLVHSCANTCLIIARASVALFPRFAQNLNQKSTCPPSCMKFCTLTPKIF
jgi:hypothetical protein